MSKGKYQRKREHAQQQAQQHSPQKLSLNKNVDAEREANGAAERKQQADDKESKSMRLGELAKRSSITDWLLALFTAALVATSIYQFIVLNGQLDVMRKDQRAWVRIEHPGPMPAVAVGTTPSISLSMVNTGKSPAKHILGDFYIEVVANGDVPRFEGDLMHNRVVMGSIAPNAPEPVPVSRRRLKAGGKPNEGEDDPIRDSEKAALEDGRAWIAIHGIVLYEDIFGTKHWIKFCSWANAVPGIFSARSCTQHNETDDK